MSLLEQLGNVWRIRDLRRKLLITVSLLAACRIGAFIPLPGVNVHALEAFGPTGGISGLLDMFTGGALGRGAIFGLGIMPYISASIIFTLLAQVVPSLEALRKEGAAGQKKLNQYTRVATVFICMFQGAMIVRAILLPKPQVLPAIVQESTWAAMRFMFTSGFILMVGTMFLMWIGEQIDEHGIGNGISLIIMINILSRMPDSIKRFAASIRIEESQQNALLKVIGLAALFVGIIVGIIYITRGERRIPVQQQKHVRGPKVYGGQKHYLPLRVNQAGVMPIIFASSLLMFPAIIAQALASMGEPGGAWSGFFVFIQDALAGGRGFLYVMMFGSLIFFFCYFWTAVMFNPKEMSENLQSNGSFIPGIRPGRRTANYLEGIMNRVTMAGSFFLVIIALLPMMVASSVGAGGGGLASMYGGTSVLIIVGVILDLVRRINDHLELRRYSGFGAGAGGRRRSRRR